MYNPSLLAFTVDDNTSLISTNCTVNSQVRRLKQLHTVCDF